MLYIQRLTEAKLSLIGGITIGVICLVIITTSTFRFIQYDKSKKEIKRLGISLSLALIITALVGFRTYTVVAEEIEHIKYIDSKVSQYEASFGKIELAHEIEFGSDFKIPIPEELEVTYDEVEFTLGEHKIEVKVNDDEVDFAKEYTINVIDTTPPTIEGVEDLSIEKGNTIDFNDLGIKAVDNHDGEIEVNLEHNVNFDEEGDYTVTAIAIDSSGNKTTDTFNVNVYQQGLQTIKFHNGGRIINYYNKGSGGGQYQIDSQPWTATTWDIGQHAYTHSNTDGMPTYMAGHYYDAFIPVTTMEVGDRVTVRDHNGHMQTYEATSRYLIGVDQSTGYVYGDASAYQRIYAFTGEGIMFQTCVANDPSVMIIVEARPI